MLLDDFIHRVKDLSQQEREAVLDDKLVLALMEKIEAEGDEELYNKFRNYFPDETHNVGSMIYWARELYPKHLEFFEAGRSYRSRCMLAANRVGKTVAGAFEMTCHLTGQYPKWWVGKQFRHPIRAWACGKTNETTRDIVQTTLLGDIEYFGSRKMVEGAGLIPRDCIGSDLGQIAWKQGVQDLIDTIKIKHRSGGWSKLGFKSYQQGRGSFEGTAQHVIWNDEEPPIDIYGEQLIRTATTKGVLMLTFTPLAGLSDVVQQFLQEK